MRNCKTMRNYKAMRNCKIRNCKAKLESVTLGLNYKAIVNLSLLR